MVVQKIKINVKSAVHTKKMINAPSADASMSLLHTF